MFVTTCGHVIFFLVGDSVTGLGFVTIIHFRYAFALGAPRLRYVAILLREAYTYDCVIFWIYPYVN